MSISDIIIVMKDGEIQQIGQPQKVYDAPANLFVAKFLGTPPINTFAGAIKSGRLYIGDSPVLDIHDIPDQEVTVGIRPEGFIPSPQGAFVCGLERVEVMGRDISVISTHTACENSLIRSIVSAENQVDLASAEVRFDLKPGKVFVFHKETEERIY